MMSIKILTPISHIFKESVLAEDITNLSDGLEARERTCELKLNKTTHYHIDFDLNLGLSEKQIQFLIDHEYASYQDGNLVANANSPNINIVKVGENPDQYQPFISTIERFTGQHYNQLPHNLNLNGIDLELEEQKSGFILYKNNQNNFEVKITKDKILFNRSGTYVELERGELNQQAIDSITSDAYQTLSQKLHPAILAPTSGRTSAPGAYQLGNSTVYFKTTESGYTIKITSGSEPETVQVTRDNLIGKVYELYYRSHGLSAGNISIDSSTGLPTIQKLTGATISDQISTVGVQEIELTGADTVNLNHIYAFRGKVSLPNFTKISRLNGNLLFSELAAPSVAEITGDLILPFASKVQILNKY